MTKFKILAACTVAIIGATLSFQASATDKSVGVPLDELADITIKIGPDGFECGTGKKPDGTPEDQAYCDDEVQLYSNSHPNQIVKYVRYCKPGDKTPCEVTYYKNGTKCKNSTCTEVKNVDTGGKKCDTAVKRSALQNLGIATRTPVVAGRNLAGRSTSTVVTQTSPTIGGGPSYSDCMGELNL